MTKRNAVLFGGTLLVALSLIACVCVLSGQADPIHFALQNVPHVMMAGPILIARRAEVVTQMRSMLDASEKENRDLTAEEQKAYDDLKAEKTTLDVRINRAQEVAEAEEALNATIPAASRRSPIQRPGGDPANREFESVGQFLHAVRFNPNDQRLNFVEGVGRQTDENGMQAEMRMDNDPSGGFMVPQQFRTNIMSVPAQEALVRPRANVIPAGSPPDAGITIPALDQSGANPANMFGGMQFQWIEEGGDKPETDADLAAVSLTPHEIAGHVTITDKLLRNWQAAGPFLENQMRQGVAAAEDYAFLRGNGVNKPLGVINAPGTKFINRALANQIGYVDILKMAAVLLMRGGSPVWSAPQSALVQFGQLTDPEGHYIWKANAVDGFAGTLMGYPLKWNNRAPALGSKGDLILADFSQYLIKDGSGPFVAASEHVKFLQNKTVIKIFWNVDGAPWLKAPIKEENGYEVSPFVGLDVPA